MPHDLCSGAGNCAINRVRHKLYDIMIERQINIYKGKIVKLIFLKFKIFIFLTFFLHNYKINHLGFCNQVVHEYCGRT